MKTVAEMILYFIPKDSCVCSLNMRYHSYHLRYVIHDTKFVTVGGQHSVTSIQLQIHIVGCSQRNKRLILVAWCMISTRTATQLTITTTMVFTYFQFASKDLRD